MKPGGKVILYSRRGIDLTKRFPYVTRALASLPDDTVVDGELVALDEEGKPNFNLLQNFRSAESHIVFYAFDVLTHKGHDLKQLPLSRRRAVLATAIEPSDHVGLSYVSDETAAQMVNFVRSHGLEGVVAKEADSVYRPGLRTGVWTKTRINLGQEFVIGGYIPSHLGVDSIVVGFYKGRISITQRACGQALCPPRGARCSTRSSI